MSDRKGNLRFAPCWDSKEIAASRKAALDIPQPLAMQLGLSAREAAQVGHYFNLRGEQVVWRNAIAMARQSKMSIPPDELLPKLEDDSLFNETVIHVTNETTLRAARRFFDSGLNPLALNFANGFQPGGGFLYGARAQEEVLCRSSALFETLLDDPMYEHHRERGLPESTDWAIVSPGVPVFRDDRGDELDHYWFVDFLTCAAPYAPDVGQARSADLLQRRINRVLSIARSFGYESLILGAWGCGEFGNDPYRTARDFHDALSGEFAGVFREIAFAIIDWSPERRLLGPFRDAFSDL